MNMNEIICHCSNITAGQIIEALDNGAKTLSDIRKVTGACTNGNCQELNPSGKCCSPNILEIIDNYTQDKL